MQGGTSISKISERIKRIRDTIHNACERRGNDASRIKLVVVTKSADIEGIKEVIRLGLVELGENRVQRLRRVSAEIEEFLAQQGEATQYPDKVSWHMVGHLQRNKVKHVLPIASLIHSVDTLRLAEEINSAAGKRNIQANIILQVNASNEPQKYGVPVGAATHLVEQMQTMSNLRPVGLMSMAPLTRNKDVIRSCFARTKELFAEVRGERVAGPEFTELSMGMSADYDIAVEEGATILRIGSAIFAG